MGNEALRQMLETTTPLGQKIDQLVMAAPDVDRRNFIDSMLGRARQFAKAITLYASSNDAAMIASRRFHHGDPRAGDVPTELGPVTSPTPSSSGATEFEQEPRFYPIDVSSISLGIFSFRAHSAYAASRELLCDMRQLFQSDQKTVPPPDQRKPPVTEVATDGGRQRYWVYVKSPDLDTYCPESF
jgi:esterase/lipase superfamily enzyme